MSASPLGLSPDDAREVRVSGAKSKDRRQEKGQG